MLKQLTLLVALTTSLAFGQESAILAREESVRKAILAEDSKTLAPMLAKNFVAIWPDGSFCDRQGQIEILGKGFKADTLELEDVNIRIHGDTAVVTGIWNVQGEWNGSKVGPRAYTHVWVKEGEDWKLSTRHLTTVSK